MAQNLDQVYRPDIDGLRAIAVLSVVIFHFFPIALSGGFVGVDIFFVISGYLISRIIFNELNNNNFKFGEFYSRRVKRIFPTLAMVLVFTMAIGWLVLLPSEFAVLGKHLNAATKFMANVNLYKESGYFDISSDAKPLLHIWSLSIEEQFYIIFPVLIFILYKIRRYTLSFILIALILSFGLNIRYLKIDSALSFYYLSSRAWEILLGSLLAYLTIVDQKYLPSFSNKNKNLLSFIALGMILYSCVNFNNKTLFPGWAALLPAIGAVILIYAKDSWVNLKILSHASLIWIGLISYPLYLWHWPLLSFATIIKGDKLSILAKSFIFISSLLLATITTLFVERPIRKKGFKVSLLLAVLMLSIFVISVPIKKNIISARSYYMSPMIAKIDFAIQDWDYSANDFETKATDILPFNKFGQGKNLTVFFGDSNMEQYWPRIKKIMSENQDLYNSHTIAFATHGGLAPIPGSDRKYRSEHEKIFLSRAIDYIKRDSVKTIVFGAQWIGYFSADAQDSQKMYQNLEKLFLDLKMQGKKLYLILNIPTEAMQNPKHMIKRKVFSRWGIVTNKAYDLNLWLTPVRAEIYNNLKIIAAKTGVIVIDPVAHLCKDGHCILLSEDGAPCYKDAVHLSAKCAREEAKYIDQILFSPA